MVNRYIVGPIGQMYMDEVTTDDLRLLMVPLSKGSSGMYGPVSYTHLRAHETDSYLVCRLLLEKKKT